MSINIRDVYDIEIDGVDTRDYPDFCDAFFAAARWIATDKELTDDELDELGDNYPDFLNEMAYESLI
jgi:hypothetical protein